MKALKLTDIHCHVIYGVDDGASNFEMTTAMLRRAAENGIDTVCCTSHAAPAQEPFPRSSYLYHLLEAQHWADSENLGIRLYQGSEIFVARNPTDALLVDAVPTLNNTRNVLVEFNPDTELDTIVKTVRQLGSAGYTAVIAHAERYDGLRWMDDLAAIKTDLGAVIQVNAGTLLYPRTFFQKRWLKRTLARGLCDVVASDAHDIDRRPCRLRAAYDLLVNELGRNKADDMCVHMPRKLLGLEPYK